MAALSAARTRHFLVSPISETENLVANIVSTKRSHRPTPEKKVPCIQQNEGFAKDIQVSDFRRKFPDRTFDTISYYVQVLKDERSVETRKLRSAASKASPEVLQYVRLPYPHAADRLLGKPNGPLN